MYKKSRLARLKQRVHGKKQLVRRKMARQLLSGALSLAQVEERDPEGLPRILRTVAYLNESEGSQIPSSIAPAVSHALAPATFGASIPQVSRGPKVPAGRQGSAGVLKSAVASESTEPLAQEVIQTPTPRRRRVASSTSETSGSLSMEDTPSATDASKKTTTARGTKKSSSVGNAKSPAVAKEKTSPTNRRSSKSAQGPSTTGEGETPVKPRQSKRQSSKPKADGEN